MCLDRFFVNRKVLFVKCKSLIEESLTRYAARDTIHESDTVEGSTLQEMKNSSVLIHEATVM
jgi:hypothetical protein